MENHLICIIHESLENKTKKKKKIIMERSNLDIRGDINKSWSLIKEGKKVEALSEAEKVPPSNPFFYDAKVLCGEIKTFMRDYEAAEQYLDEAIALKPDSPHAYMRRAWLRCSQELPELGLNDINKAQGLIETMDNSLVEDWIITGIEETREALLEQLEQQQTNICKQEKIHGELPRFQFTSEQKLSHISTYDIGCEFSHRLETEIKLDATSFDLISLFFKIQKQLEKKLEVFENRFSLKRLSVFFARSYLLRKSPEIPIKNATYVDIGCGSINPFISTFLFLMLGAKKGICLEPAPLENPNLMLEHLAQTIGKIIINPQEVFGNYPITREEIIKNIASFKLESLAKGDWKGLDENRLIYLQESVTNNTIPDNEADVIFTNSVLEHLPDVNKAFEEFSRITKKGGYGIHNVDGIDHWSYNNSELHPLEFLKIETKDKIVHLSNRIRPLSLVEIFESHGFEIVEIRPNLKINVDKSLRESFAEPFRSMNQKYLEVARAWFLVRKL